MTSKKAKSSDVSLIIRIISKFRYGLVLQVIRNQLARIGIGFTPYYWVQEGIDYTEMPEIKGIISDYSVEFFDAKDMRIIVENARGYSVQEFLSWLKDGRKCLGIKHKDKIAGFMWINLSECKFKPGDICLNKDEAYLSDMYTMESYRGINIAPFIRYKSYEILKKMGRNKIYSVSEYFNSSAIKYKQKLNARNLKFVLNIQLFNKLRRSFIIKTY